MKDNRKKLAVAIIILIVGAGVVPSISGSDDRNISISNIEGSKEEISNIGEPLGLLAYYSFNDCTADDDSGNGNHGVNFGARCVPGYNGTAFEFFYQDIVHYIPSSFDDTVTDYLRIESWVYWYGGDFTSIIFDAREFIPYEQGFVFTISQNGNVMFLLKSPAGDQIILSESTIPVNDWTHITAIFDYESKTISILINNIEDNTINAIAPYFNTGGVAAIGNNRWAPGDGEWAPFNGIIDELRIYDSVACELEVKLIHDVYRWGISMIIKNHGECDCTDVKWSITVEGGLFGFIINKETSGTIPCIGPGEEVTVRTGLIFGFGRITITGSAESDEGSSDTKTQDAFVFLFFIKIL